MKKKNSGKKNIPQTLFIDESIIQDILGDGIFNPDSKTFSDDLDLYLGDDRIPFAKYVLQGGMSLGIEQNVKITEKEQQKKGKK